MAGAAAKEGRAGCRGATVHHCEIQDSFASLGTGVGGAHCFQRVFGWSSDRFYPACRLAGPERISRAGGGVVEPPPMIPLWCQKAVPGQRKADYIEDFIRPGRLVGIFVAMATATKGLQGNTLEVRLLPQFRTSRRTKHHAAKTPKAPGTRYQQTAAWSKTDPSQLAWEPNGNLNSHGLPQKSKLDKATKTISPSQRGLLVRVAFSVEGTQKRVLDGCSTGHTNFGHAGSCWSRACADAAGAGRTMNSAHVLGVDFAVVQSTAARPTTKQVPQAVTVTPATGSGGGGAAQTGTRGAVREDASAEIERQEGGWMTYPCVVAPAAALVQDERVDAGPPAGGDCHRVQSLPPKDPVSRAVGQCTGMESVCVFVDGSRRAGGTSTAKGRASLSAQTGGAQQIDARVDVLDS
ncbi:hypothetical protein Purlil1_4372 [Purpureocillium lilacinum]|uniref:Uncharacterized protein n=1 Tax=Purpureocillium lilacinum TaxID=33203 RepID=A0ABR0C5W0_PURLI|nr:hypothetical protein Purlil1_4372 [Purpureocillium lilacinum]